MKTLPKPDRRAKTGSNLKLAAKPMPRPRLTPAEKALQAAQRLYRGELTRLLPAAQRRKIKTLAAAARAEWQKQGRTVDGDLARRDALKVAARQALQRQLVRTVPGYRAALALQKKYHAERQRLLRPGLAVVAGLPVLTGWPVAPVDEMQSYQPPFPLYEIRPAGLATYLADDDSFVWPDSGQIIQNFTFVHNESNWGLASDANFINHFASCGLPCTMARRGFVQVGAEIENLYNRLNFSITDNFGFSHSTLAVETRLFIAIVQNGVFREFGTSTLLRTVVSSGGDDISRSISDLDNAESYAVGMVTASRLEEGEEFTVLAGAEIAVDSDTDDMDAHVRATYWWRLKRLTVGVL